MAHLDEINSVRGPYVVYWGSRDSGRHSGYLFGMSEYLQVPYTNDRAVFRRELARKMRKNPGFAKLTLVAHGRGWLSWNRDRPRKVQDIYVVRPE